MSTILDTIADYARHRVEQAEKNISISDMRRLAEQICNAQYGGKKSGERDTALKNVLNEKFSFEKELARLDITFIC